MKTKFFYQKLFVLQSIDWGEAELIMRENNYKPQIPDMMEAIFDAVYLIFYTINEQVRDFA